MRVVLAPDKFKGSCSAAEVAASLARGIRSVVPDAELQVLPVADGGEGTLEAAVHAGFTTRTVTVTGPTGLPVDAAFAVRGRDAVVELARASGLALLPGGEPDALGATSRGTGELVVAALDAGCERVVVGVGGSACTDGGAGLLQALGARLLDHAGREIPAGGAALARLDRVDLSGLDPRLASVELVLAGDVRNPLLGADGAAHVFGPQKGAGPADVETLDTALGRFVDVLDRARLADRARGPAQAGDDVPGLSRNGLSARDAAELPGAGAAGGVGFAVLAVLGGRSRSGIEVVLELVGVDAALEGAMLVVTGEGSLDDQSLSGKAPVGLAHAAARAGVPVVAVCGRLLLDEAAWRGAGFEAVHALSDLAPDAATSMREAPHLLVEVGARIAANVPVGALAHGRGSR